MWEFSFYTCWLVQLCRGGAEEIQTNVKHTAVNDRMFLKEPESVLSSQGVR